MKTENKKKVIRKNSIPGQGRYYFNQTSGVYLLRMTPEYKDIFIISSYTSTFQK